MLVAVFADISQELLHFGNFHNTRAAESLQRVVGKFSLADVAAYDALAVDRRETREAHGAALYLADGGAEGVVLADRAGDDFLEVHAYLAEEVLGQIAAVEADGFVGIGPVVVVPVQQRAGGTAGKSEHVHAERTGNVG